MPLKSNISKKDMTEEDIKNRFVTPALSQAGWESGLILMEKYFTAGRILVPTKGKRHAKKDGNKADYILFAEPNLPIAIVEAKDNNQPVSGGIQQAIRYAEILDLPFAFSSNGDGFFEFDRTTGIQRPDRHSSGARWPSWSRTTIRRATPSPARPTSSSQSGSPPSPRSRRYDSSTTSSSERGSTCRFARSTNPYSNERN